MTPSLSILVGVCLFLSTVSPQKKGAVPWWTVQDRVVTGAGSLGAHVIEIDLSRSRMRVASVPFETGKRPGEAQLNVNELADQLQTRPDYRLREWVVVNGGFSSADPDSPVGLLVVDGRVYSTLSKMPSRFADNLSPFAAFRLSGVLCSRGGIWSILSVPQYKAGTCSQALQAGPVLVEPGGRLAISKTELGQQPFLRSVLCLTSTAKARVVLTKAPAHLYHLAVWMASPEANTGLGCDSALNLSGDSSAGAVIKPLKGSLRTFGEGSFPIPSAMIFTSR